VEEEEPEEVVVEDGYQELLLQEAGEGPLLPNKCLFVSSIGFNTKFLKFQYLILHDESYFLKNLLSNCN